MLDLLDSSSGVIIVARATGTTATPGPARARRLRLTLLPAVSMLALAVVSMAVPATAHAQAEVAVSTPALAPTQAARRAQGFGVGIGAGTIANGLSLKYYLGGASLQGVVGTFGGGNVGDRFTRFNGIAGSLDYLFEMPSLARSQYFTVDWSFGLGGGFGVQTFSNGSPALAGSGIAGLEFNFTKVPLDLVIEYRPSVGFLPDFGLNLVNFTAQLRIYFG
jgi:hypothetical protein